MDEREREKERETTTKMTMTKTHLPGFNAEVVNHLEEVKVGAGAHAAGIRGATT
jgi:hypothetical protein